MISHYNRHSCWPVVSWCDTSYYSSGISVFLIFGPMWRSPDFSYFDRGCAVVVVVVVLLSSRLSSNPTRCKNYPAHQGIPSPPPESECRLSPAFSLYSALPASLSRSLFVCLSVSLFSLPLALIPSMESRTSQNTHFAIGAPGMSPKHWAKRVVRVNQNTRTTSTHPHTHNKFNRKIKLCKRRWKDL